MNELALFAGAGGGLLGSRLLGWRTKCAVEIDAYARSVLLARQRDGHLEPFPIWDDVCTFDGRFWRGSIDVVTGGFPCQDISAAGKGAGIAGPRSGLFFEMLRIVKEVQPRFVFAENSPNLRTNGLPEVIEGLDSLGYDVRWCVLGAWHVGAPHKRNRMWVLGHLSNTVNPKQRFLQRQREAKTQTSNGSKKSSVVNTLEVRRIELCRPGPIQKKHCTSKRSSWWSTEPAVGRLVDGLAYRVDRLKALGNGQVPAVAALAFEILSAGLVTGREDRPKDKADATPAAKQHAEDSNG